MHGAVDTGREAPAGSGTLAVPGLGATAVALLLTGLFLWVGALNLAPLDLPNSLGAMGGSVAIGAGRGSMSTVGRSCGYPASGYSPSTW